MGNLTINAEVRHQLPALAVILIVAAAFITLMSYQHMCADRHFDRIAAESRQRETERNDAWDGIRREEHAMLAALGIADREGGSRAKNV